MGTVKKNLDSSTLIRGIYRALLNTGRTYAAFEKRHSVLFEILKDRKEIFDPMSGYGGLMKFCTQSGCNIKSYGVECNPPSYYWQVLINPSNSQILRELCLGIEKESRRWPKPQLSVAVSDDWFPDESMRILELLWRMTYSVATRISQKQAEEISLAFLLPFVGRFSTTIQGNIVTYVKKGGLCIYAGWRDDFCIYINKLRSELFESNMSKTVVHTIKLGDARTINLGRKKFSAMLTSPPYPNSVDYAKMFNPENFYIEWLVKNGYISDVTLKDRLIGSSDVSSKGRYTKHTPDDVKSSVAKNFLDYIANYNKTADAKYDNEVYYLPLFCNYFHGMEKSYENISRYLSNDFEGYIIVVNNTARKHVIPVSDFVMETWKNLGFKAQIYGTKEMSHVGGINSGVKGLSSRHTEYIIRINN